jgi:hypothetical protein
MAHTKAPTPNDRPARLLKAIPQTATIREAMLEAGYSEHTALHSPRRTIESAISNMEKRAIDGDKRAANLLEAVGISRSELQARYKHLVLNGSEAVSLAASKPLLREAFGLNFEEEQVKTAPTVNIGIIENGSTQPPIVTEGV